ncbi:uncharacterized protein LOC143080015 [Mytilus galloprovincialis]|uniref:uncharacterized protein LOC143080015 n=1 Tax=Mytilus galloprovincialis TaxID=29158 RepID=UPI003F7BD910
MVFGFGIAYVCRRHMFGLFKLQHQRFMSNYSMKECLSKVQDFQFSPYLLNNYTIGTSFSEAIVKPVECVADENGNLRNPESIPEDLMSSYISYRVNFKDLFADGFHMLSDSESLGRIYQLAPLFNFLWKKDYHEKCLRKALQEHRDRKKFTESQISMLLAIHLLSQLVFPSDDPGLTDTSIPLPYIMSNDVPDKVVTCPCGCGRTVFYGNTGIGTTALWYGKPDILVFPNGGVCGLSGSPVNQMSAFHEFKEEEEQLVEEENELSSLRHMKSIRQFSAQAITFSYYQASIQEQNSSNSESFVSLIPTIAISEKGFDVYMYDSVNEIFFRNCGDPLPLWNEQLPANHNATINISSVVTLWMLINHLTLRPAVTPAHVSLFGGSASLGLDNKQIQEIKRTITISKDFPVPNILEKINLTKKKTV